MLAQNGKKRLPIGNTRPVRDFLHVHDVVRAYIALAEHGESSAAYNVSSGKGWAVGEIIKLVLDIADLDATPHPDDSLVRPVEVERLVGESRKLAHGTGWRAERSLDDIVRELWACPAAP